MEGTSDEAFHWKSRRGRGENVRKGPPAGENSGNQRKPGAEAPKDREEGTGGPGEMGGRRLKSLHRPSNKPSHVREGVQTFDTGEHAV
ncbi:hypothetical protein AKJ49_02360 [candidate division MSBL1 archaeon SCGC-AAA382A03]|uniref:Uncharacterized protein n=1 Tax=candidate division MSBL1 archaeon SCGC-AAA382A03 TaxID=1698278 RepID=A0A133VC81_9EURY|nr:hypothetical protein AKJ49_02360 [candidate division MSBL1 archaeon SCGC-AAA382A03]